jgi:hypothetical protein
MVPSFWNIIDILFEISTEWTMDKYSTFSFEELSFLDKKLSQNTVNSKILNFILAKYICPYQTALCSDFFIL